MRIQVTQQDIDQGICGSPSRCPISRAVKRATGETDVSTGDLILFWTAGRRVAYRTPASAASFITRFDSDLSVAPFEFELGEPQ